MANTVEKGKTSEFEYRRKINIPIATRNPYKQAEIIRIAGRENVHILELAIDETQNADPFKVSKKKAFEGYKINNFQPVITEETSLEIPSLLIVNSPYVADWASHPEQRKQLCEILTSSNLDRTVQARVIFSVYTGTTPMYDESLVKSRTGIATGRIALIQNGDENFGWDDIFEVETPQGWKTFASMLPEEKDMYSMRAKALLDLIQHPFEIESI